MPTGRRDAAAKAVIHGLEDMLFPSPEFPAIILMFRYLGFFSEVMFPIVELIEKLLDVGNHMFDWPEQCQTSPKVTFVMEALEYSPVPVHPVQSY